MKNLKNKMKFYLKNKELILITLLKHYQRKDNKNLFIIKQEIDKI